MITKLAEAVGAASHNNNNTLGCYCFRYERYHSQTERYGREERTHRALAQL